MRNSKRGYDQFITQTYGSIIWEGNGNTNPQKCKIDNAIAQYRQKCSHIWLSILVENYTTCCSIM